MSTTEHLASQVAPLIPPAEIKRAQSGVAMVDDRQTGSDVAKVRRKRPQHTVQGEPAGTTSGTLPDNGGGGATRKAAIRRPDESAKSYVDAEGISVFCLSFALVIWAFSLATIDPDGLTDYGIVSILPWQIWASLAILTTGFALTLTPKLASGPLPLLHLVGLVVVLHATPAIVYETLRYSWAWKHLGIVDFIQRHGTVDQVAPYLSAYHNWPGLFAPTAWVANEFGWNSLDLSRFVRFTPVVLGALYLFALSKIFRRFTDDARLIMAAMWIFVAGNWIGQDYFSPQGVTFLLYLLVLAICLGPLRADMAWPRGPRRGTIHRTALFVTSVSHAPEVPYREASGLSRACFAATALVLILAITVTHQLTPIVLILALGALAAIGRLSIGYCVFAIVANTLWLLYGAAPFVITRLADELGAFGSGLLVVSERLAEAATVSPERAWVVLAGRALTVAIGVAAIMGGLRRLAAGYRDGPAVVLILVVLPLFTFSYGGEILFRAYLFALPFLSFFAAAMFFPSRSRGKSWAVRCLFALFGLLASAGFFMSNNGKDREYRFTPDEVETARWLYATAPPGTLLIEGARSYPSQFLNYENFTYVPISEEDASVRKSIIRDPAEVLGRWLSDGTRSAAFIIITSSQKAYLDSEGIMPAGALQHIEERLLASPRFIVVKASRNAIIFALHPTVGRLGLWSGVGSAPSFPAND